jgi:flagellar basal body rod protein FlgB
LVPPDDAKLELTDAEKARFLLEEIRREATHAMTHTAVIDEDDLQRELDALSDTGGDVSGSDDNDIDLDKELDELMRMAVL